MKKISNYTKENVQSLSAGNYQVVFDVTENDYIITKRGKVNSEQIWAMDFTVKTETFKEATAINREFKANQLKLVCYTTVKSMCGKKMADEMPVFVEVDNPYYKCASSMKLYVEAAVLRMMEKKNKKHAA